MTVKRFNYVIQPITPTDAPFLREMLYQAIYVPEGGPAPPREIVNTPELSRYVKDWGRADDRGFLAIDAKTRQPVGAVWLRLMTEDEPGYGYLDDDTPELSIAVLPQYRGAGVGTRLLTRMLQESEGVYKAISLSVSTDNPAVRLYKRVGFEVASGNSTSLTMRRSGARASP
jgi:ribosomal protein S18 acetylase RimI-like enzyme